MNRPTCSTCKFRGTVLAADRTITLVCRRHPPTVTVAIVGQQGGGFGTVEATAWPKVKPEDFCGEHSPEVVLQ